MFGGESSSGFGLCAARGGRSRHRIGSDTRLREFCCSVQVSLCATSPSCSETQNRWCANITRRGFQSGRPALRRSCKKLLMIDRGLKSSPSMATDENAVCALLPEHQFEGKSADVVKSAGIVTGPKRSVPLQQLSLSECRHFDSYQCLELY